MPTAVLLEVCLILSAKINCRWGEHQPSQFLDGNTPSTPFESVTLLGEPN
jgi:hypothetical protein